MTSSKPYLLRAIYDWLVDNQRTPHILVDATRPRVQVPERYINDGQIVLNIAPQAVQRLSLSNEEVRFHARFAGVVHHIVLPTDAVLAVYAFEDGRGMIFSDETMMDTQVQPGPESDDTPPSPGGNTPPKKGRPSLKVIK